MPSSSTFQDALTDQMELAGFIERFWTNVSKIGRDKLTWAVIEQRKALLERYWDSFFNGHRHLIRCKEAASSDYVREDVFSKVEEAYLNIGAMLTQCLADKPQPGSATTAAPVLVQPQLPKINLPSFSGDPLQWESFRDQFRSLVHDAPNLSDVQRLLYLKSSLTGEAAEVIRNTSITDVGYLGAWEDLEMRYGNQRLISFSHHRALLACPPAQKTSSAELKRLLDTFRQTIRAYQALRKPVSAWDEWFVYILGQKLDPTTHLAWETSLSDSKEIPTFAQLSKFLENRIQALDATHTTDPILRPSSSNSSSAKTVHPSIGKRGRTSLATSSKPAPARHCLLCEGAHSLAYCAKFKALSASDRKARVHSFKVCLNCLSSGHDRDKCASKVNCLVCGKRHHTLIHESSQGNSSSHVGTHSGLPRDLAEATASSSQLTASSRATALLATARVLLESATGEELEVRALLDTGSDTSLVSEWVAQALRLTRRSVRVAISGVQEKDSGIATAEVSFVAKPRQVSTFRLPVRALVLKRLTSMLPSSKVTHQSWPHIAGLSLADPHFGVPSRVDLILGADVCASLFQDGTRAGPPGTPTAKLTPFGWILMGAASADVNEARMRHSFHFTSRLLRDHRRYVNNTANPADLATRGISPSELSTADLCWQGPPWLKMSQSAWPALEPAGSKVAETEMRSAKVLLTQSSQPNTLLQRYSSLSRLLAVTALCLRFADNSRHPTQKRTGFLTASERQRAFITVLRLSQRDSYGRELHLLVQQKELAKGSLLSSLRPFIDDEGLLRVGGRLSNALLPYDEKHPFIISRDCPLATLLVRDAHLRTLHGGPQLTRSLLERRIWIPRGRSLYRAVIHACVKCARYGGRPVHQLMGQIPATRLTPQRAFLTTGVDYAGPIKLRTTRGRGHRAYKGYISLFVCLTTRAIHLEVVSDLTSAAFLAAFRRFVSRRGRCRQMLSDNGTVFHGADRELRAMFSSAAEFYRQAAASLANDGTEWKFIPPYAPHFGGLWEAGVKSVKHHLRRVIGDSTLTFEEMTTLLCQVEACLNSRPLYPMSDDPSDLCALTPGHFLIGEPPVSVPEPEPENVAAHLLTRWQLVSKMRSLFWHRWSREYLHHLQQLSKWRQQKDSLKVGSLVFIRDENRPPAKWPLARVEALHPGSDGLTRVVTLRTADGTVKRPIVKVSPLPVVPAGTT